MNRDAAALAGIFALALAMRLLYLGQIESLPFVQFPLIDASAYHEWAKSIAAGDWLGDEVFYQAPAYPYFLAVIYSVFGASLETAQIVQMGLGAASCVLVYLATRSMFGRAAAIAAGGLLALYAPALFFDGMIQKTSLGLFLTSVLLVLLASVARSPGWGRLAASGAVVGLLALTRENALIFAVVIPLWVIGRRREANPAKRLAWAGAFALGVALVLVPVGFRNLAVGNTFALTTSQLGPNFYIGNNPDATGVYAPLMPGRHTPDFEGADAARAAEWDTGRKLMPGEVSGYWLGRSLEWIAEAPGAWLSLLVTKLLFTWNDYEIPDTEDIYVHAEFSWLLSGLHRVLRFGVLLPLGLAGLAFAWREREAGSASELVAALFVVFSAAVALFYVWARYRFPIVPLLIPFAGLACVRALPLARLRDWRGLALPGTLLVVGAGIANLPLFDREQLSQAAWLNLGNIMLREKKLSDADAYLARAKAIPHESADLYLHLAALRFQQDRKAEAEESVRHMLEVDPTDYRGHKLLAELLRARGLTKEANQHLLESVRLDPERKRKGRPGAPLPAPLREETTP